MCQLLRGSFVIHGGALPFPYLSSNSYSFLRSRQRDFRGDFNKERLFELIEEVWDDNSSQLGKRTVAAVRSNSGDIDIPIIFSWQTNAKI